MSMSLSVDRNQVGRLLGFLDGIEQGAEKALHRTLVASQKKAKVEASKKIRSQLALSKKYVDQKIKLGKPSYRKLEGRLYASKRGALLTRFKYRKNPTGRGYYVNVKKGRGKLIQNAALIKRLKHSNVPGLAVWRNGKFDVLHAPSPSQVLNTFLPGLREQMSKFTIDRLEKEVAGVLRRKGY